MSPHTALIVIDMQRDFCSPGGYADTAGMDVQRLREPIAHIQQLLTAARANGLPKVAPFSLPLGELESLAQTAGLQWVNSDADKIAAVQAAIAAEPRPIHVPRERPPLVELDEGPLVLVETRKDLRQVTLPFEQQGGAQPH